MMKFKKSLITIILLGTISMYCRSQGKVEIQVYAPKLKDGTELKLTEANLLNSRNPINTYKIVVRNGKSEKIISTGNGDEFWIANGNDMKEIHLQPGKVKIEILDTLISNMIVSGNPSADDYNKYMENLKSQSFYIRTREFKQDLTTAESTRRADSAMVEYHRNRIQFTLNRITENPSSYINSYLLYSVKDLISREEFLKYFNTLNSGAKFNNAGSGLNYLIDSIDIGGILPGFTKVDPLGNLVDFKSFLGKYVLVDFWASWCVPCRAENPNLKTAYAKFHPKNFTIVSVSIDKTKDAWIKAVKEDNLEWTQLLDASSDVYKKFALNKVPSNFLIGPKGEIIGKDLRGNDLMEALEKVLK